MTDYVIENTYGTTRGTEQIKDRKTGKYSSREWAMTTRGFKIRVAKCLVAKGSGFVTEDYFEQAKAIALRRLKDEPPRSLGLDAEAFEKGKKAA